MTPCAKCGHDFSDHDFRDIDFYGHCTHYNRIGMCTVSCICSECESQNPCRCETCEKHRKRNS